MNDIAIRPILRCYCCTCKTHVADYEPQVLGRHATHETRVYPGWKADGLYLKSRPGPLLARPKEKPDWSGAWWLRG